MKKYDIAFIDGFICGGIIMFVAAAIYYTIW